MARVYYPKRSELWTISRERYAELRSFCLQYPRWKVEVVDETDLSSPRLDGMPRSSDPGDPTERAVERREKLLAKIRLVEGCACDVWGGAWARALILNVCNGMSWEVIRDMHPEALKSSDRTRFFIARKHFFKLLDERKD